ncbi:hypothetical protein LFL96_26000 [Paraburkholderia sp. D15]|uniref:hypothetical protein n=1 Tax=Paraburkholderia sp. D15 TaxID=2880218 RepID=UPI0024791F24|nr:hypothetical protein [Paraburkholderia sp. D15]WGS54470.1 hypothetical protein LFL96_26000 [Paraburkholderia sp. D15]
MTNIQRLTEDAIEQETQTLANSVCLPSLIEVIRENYDTWREKLFPVLKLRGLARYRYIADLLKKAGYGNASEELVRGYMHKVKVERAKKNMKGE